MSPDADAPDGHERALDELLQRASDSAQSSLDDAIDVEQRLREFHTRREALDAEGSTERVWSEEELADMKRAVRPGSQPLPVPNQREGAHDALLRERLSEAVADRKLLGLTRYHTLLQAGNGRDSLRDAVEEALDLAAYLQVWTQARDEALGLLSELRADLAGGDAHRDEDTSQRDRRRWRVEQLRKVEHLLGGGTRA